MLVLGGLDNQVMSPARAGTPYALLGMPRKTKKTSKHARMG